jgi:LysM repeat protein
MKPHHFLSNTKQYAKKAAPSFLFASLTASLFLTSSCVDKGHSAAYDHGPFDANGNYIEEWADNPKYSRSRNNPPVSSDLDAGMVAAHETPLPTVNTTDSPSRSARTQSTPKPSTSPKTSTSTKPKVTATKPTTKPKVATTKPKPKTPTRVVVKKGDTLYELALRHKTSVSAIQKANGLRSTVLQIGKSLVIPK